MKSKIMGAILILLSFADLLGAQLTPRNSPGVAPWEIGLIFSRTGRPTDFDSLSGIHFLFGARGVRNLNDSVALELQGALIPVRRGPNAAQFSFGLKYRLPWSLQDAVDLFGYTRAGGLRDNPSASAFLQEYAPVVELGGGAEFILAGNRSMRFEAGDYFVVGGNNRHTHGLDWKLSVMFGLE